MQTTKQSHNGRQSVLHFLVRQALNTLFQLPIRVVRNERRGVLVRIHEVLERGVASLLELNVVSKRVCN
jgi:hypothetical protein